MRSGDIYKNYKENRLIRPVEASGRVGKSQERRSVKTLNRLRNGDTYTKIAYNQQICNILTENSVLMDKGISSAFFQYFLPAPAKSIDKCQHNSYVV